MHALRPRSSAHTRDVPLRLPEPAVGFAVVSAGVDVFAERLLQVIDEGRRTATYKLALLMALIDACGAQSDRTGRAPTELHTRTIAEHVLRLYLPQVRAFLASSGRPLHLRQITMKRAEVLTAVLDLHLHAHTAGVTGLRAISKAFPDRYEATLDRVEYTFARYPLLRLQVLGTQHRPFLYDVDWRESVTLKALHAPDGGRVVLRAGAGDQLLRLAPLLRPLIELHWGPMVARLNDIDTEGDQLRAHLFGSTRRTFPPALRAGLTDLQESACFYCGERVGARSQIDHVIPWARWPNDAIENLVLADACNTAKRDHLPGLAHIDHWARRLVTHADHLTALAETARWESDPERSIAIARTAYAHLPTGTPLWAGPDDFRDDDPALVVARLGDLPPTYSRR